MLGSAIALAKRGCEVSVAAINNNPSITEKVYAEWPMLVGANVDVEIYNKSMSFLPGASKNLLESVKERAHCIDVIHVHGVWERIYVDLFKLAQAHKIKFFISVHGMLDAWSLKQSPLKKRIALRYFDVGAMLSNADGVMFGTISELREAQSVVPMNALVLANGVSLDDSMLSKLDFSADLLNLFERTQNWRRTFLFFGRVNPKKGLDTLVEAFLHLPPKYHDVGLLIVGLADDDNYERRIRERIQNNTLSNNILWVDGLSGRNAKSALLFSDVFVLPSHQEGFSMAILEAMTASLPLLITSQCHMPEVESNWRNGFVVEDTVKAVMEGLVRMAELDDDDLRQMGTRGRQTVLSFFEWSKVSEALICYYSGCAAA